MSQKFAMLLEQMMEKRELSRKDLCEKLEVSHQAVQKWLAGKNAPRGRTMKKLADVLECQVEDMLEAASDKGEVCEVLSCDPHELNVFAIKASNVWLKHETDAGDPHDLVLFVAPDDRMSPTIKKGEIVIIDRTMKLRTDVAGVFLFEDYSLKGIYRLQWQPVEVAMLSDNPLYSYKPSCFVRRRAMELHCVGQCVGKISVSRL